MNAGIRRRCLLALLAAAAIMRPTAAHVQPSAQTKTVAFLMGLADDAEAKARIDAFERGLRAHGWKIGDNIRIIYRFAAGDPARMRAYARELVALRPDVIVGHSTPVVTQLRKATNKIPIVFVVVADPVGSGFVASFPKPGGNATGFTNLSATITAKLLTILKQISPGLTHVGLMLNPETGVSAGRFYLRPFERAAPSFDIKPVRIPVHTPADIERLMSALARERNAGLIVMPDNFLTVNRQRIIATAARLGIPAVYPYRYFAEGGGLMSYGVDVRDLFRRAPEYVSRILRGADPADLPVQAPTKFELVINLKTAEALGLKVPRILLAGADALID